MGIDIVKYGPEIRWHAEGERVQLIINGKLVLDISWQDADRMSAGARATARRAEEYARAPQIARDSAIMLRAGAPWILSSRQDIADEAVKMACHDREVRQMPYIKSQEKFGHPTFEILPPAKPRSEP